MPSRILKFIALVFLSLLLEAPYFARALPTQLSAPPENNISASVAAQRALVDSLYYEFDRWFEIFDERIAFLEAQPESRDNTMERMRFYFAYAGLLGEVSHTLAFTSQYKIDSVAKPFSYYSEMAKKTAREIIDRDDASPSEKAEAYMYLGGAEGYIAIFEYGQGDLVSALINGLQADGHLEKALDLDSRFVDSNFGLGMYRYGNSRLGGFGNFILQGGSDLRKEGLAHIETALREDASSRPLVYKTLIWFNISEQINPANANLPKDHVLAPHNRRARVLELLAEFKSAYFSDPARKDFIGNKEYFMMDALQAMLDGRYRDGKAGFEKALEICDYLIKVKKMPINPQLIRSVKAGIEFCELMLMKPDESGDAPLCLKVSQHLDFLKNGGAMLEYDSKKIQRELQDVFTEALKKFSNKNHC
ncbi:MAG: hypothetical protein G3M78_07495 [Candidatus Nitrohelix vancouverensis]|uniref:Uncharacterized protein n=1 Tax=Candidatus Nitrohelix vancouverensis TaxID=2705534 RepID=A0A7T0G3D2_9BACT|nr:MAG: hypothetical protein G3M78_07495 [Candidatus Nitrohelix vancouverensis]